MKKTRFITAVACLFAASYVPGLFAAPTASEYSLPHVYLDEVPVKPKVDGDPKFRNRCEIVKDESGNVVSNHTDWIVFPGIPNGSMHRHIYAGVSGTNENTVFADLVNLPSTCWGGFIKDGMWTIGLQHASDLSDANPSHFTVYYARGAGGANWPTNAAAMITPLPNGMILIAGKASDPAYAQWMVVKKKLLMGCVSAAGGTYNNAVTTAIPECLPGDELQIKFVYPSCFRGTSAMLLDLDSPNHMDHAAYPQTGDYLTAGNKTTSQCPSTHPYRSVTVIGLWHYPGGRYVADGGFQLHMDYAKQVNDYLFDAPFKDCILGGMDCGVGLLGNSGLRSKFPGFN